MAPAVGVLQVDLGGTGFFVLETMRHRVCQQQQVATGSNHSSGPRRSRSNICCIVFKPLYHSNQVLNYKVGPCMDPHHVISTFSESSFESLHRPGTAVKEGWFVELSKTLQPHGLQK